MTEDLVVRESRDLAIPFTGEVVDLDDAPAVARALHSVREHKQMVEEARSILEGALVAESTRVGTKTLRFGTLTASVGPDSELQWDMTEIVKLLEAGLPQERYDELVTEIIEYKVNAAVAKQIEGANPAYAEIIARARRRAPKKQYVRVEQA